MNRFNQLLIVVLVAQVLIAGGLYLNSQGSSVEQVQMAIVTVEQSQIDRINIDEGKEKQAVLSRVNGKWQLPNYHQLPANQGKVEKLLDSLMNTQSGWPVATTEPSRERFEVTEDNFQKRVVLSQGDKTVSTLYLGTSPGFRQLHLRRINEDEVYAVKLNSHDFPSQAEEWLDKALLQPGGDIVSLTGPDFAFIKQGDEWQLTQGEGEAVTDEIEKITRTLANLTVLGAEEKTIDGSGYQLTIKAAGDTYQYRFLKEGEDHFIHRDNYAQVFKIDKSDYEKVTGQTALQLVKQPVAEAESADAEVVAEGEIKSTTLEDSQEAPFNQEADQIE